MPKELAAIFRMPLLVAMLACALSVAPSAFAQGVEPEGAATSERPASLNQRIYECFIKGDYQQAVVLIKQRLEQFPNDADALYNLACAYCQLQQFDDAASALLRSFRAGFNDIEHLRTDPDLKGLRDHATYKRILEEADKVSSRASRNALEQWKQTYGSEHYTYQSDTKRRINYAVALDDQAFAAMRSMLEREADQLTKSLFDGQVPGYDILIAVPTPADADKFFEGQDDIGGMYQHPLRRLVARDIGGSLRHEFVHALHYADMERILQRHPLWLQEGLASLYEDYEIDAAGNIRFLPNDRQIVVKAKARAGRLTHWRDLFKMDAQTFMFGAQRNYPQVRSIFEFVADQSKLADWYHTYVKTYKDDPTSAKAFEEVFGKPLEDIERDWRKWVSAQPGINLQINEGDAALGVRSGDNLSNDGVLITDILPGSAASRSTLRRGDVIVSLDGRSTASMSDLRRIIASKHVGDEVELKARREQQYFTVKVVLRALASGY